MLRTQTSRFSHYLYSYLTLYKQAFCNFNIIFKRTSNTAVVSDIVAVLEHNEMVGALVKAYLVHDCTIAPTSSKTEIFPKEMRWRKVGFRVHIIMFIDSFLFGYIMNPKVVIDLLC